MADVSQLSRLMKKADAVSHSASYLVAKAIRDIRGEIANLSGELNIAGNADDRDKAYDMVRRRMKRLSRRLDTLLEAQQQLTAKSAAKSAATLTGLEVKYSPSRAKAICELVTPAQGENLAAVFTDRMGRKLINSLREATVATLREQAVAGGTLKETAREMSAKWQAAMRDERPVFVDSGGHAWNTETYFQMNVRTNTMRIYNDCLADNVARATGSDLMRISTGGSDPNCECAAWEGCIVSLTGKTDGFPTYEDARKGGCFHPNCVHTLEPVDETADAAEIALQKTVPAKADMASDWEAQDSRKYAIDQARKVRDEGLTPEQARVAVDRDNLAASIRAGLVRGDAEEVVRKMTDAQVTALCPDGNPPEFMPTKKATKADPHAADQKWNHGKWGGVVHVDRNATAEQILKVCKVEDAQPPTPPTPPAPKPAPTPTPTPPAPDEPADFDKLPAEQRSALKWYVSGEGQYVNQALRGNVGADFGGLTQAEKDAVAAMRAATDHPLAKDLDVLYRSVDARAVFGNVSQSQYENMCDYFRSTGSDRRYYERQIGDLVSGANGREIVEKGFMSTTRDRDIALNWGGFTGSDMPITLELKLSSGVRGIDLRKLDVDDMPQKEVLLHPGMRYRVLEVTHVDGVPYVKAEIVSSQAKSAEPPKPTPTPPVSAPKPPDAKTPAPEKEAPQGAQGTSDAVPLFKTGKEAEEYLKAKHNVMATGLERFTPEGRKGIVEATADAIKIGAVRPEYLQHVGIAKDVYGDAAARKKFFDAYNAAGPMEKFSVMRNFGRNGRGVRMGLTGDDLLWYGFCERLKPKGKTVAFCISFGNPVAAKFNGIYFNPKAIGESGAEYVKKGWWVPGAEDVKGTMAHELGHVIDASLSKNGIRLREQTEIYDIWREAGDKAGVAKALSTYGATNRAEMIAEAWCEYTCSKNPRPLAMRIGNLIKSKLEKR